MKKLYLVRHGNTFGPNDRVCWVGAKTDLPLVEYGLKQAAALGETFAKEGVVADRIFAGPLKRTRQTATLIAEALQYPVTDLDVTEALREIDYGTWEGLSNDDIRAKFGDREIDDWQQRAIWPDDFEWSPSPKEIIDGWRELLNQINDGETAIFVSSNGIFKVLAPLFSVPAEESKVRTGCYSVIERIGRDLVPVIWNEKPCS